MISLTGAIDFTCGAWRPGKHLIRRRNMPDDAPVLIRIESRAGHGGGTPTSKRIEQAADAWAFLVQNLDIEID